MAVCVLGIFHLLFLTSVTKESWSPSLWTHTCQFVSVVLCCHFMYAEAVLWVLFVRHDSSTVRFCGRNLALGVAKLRGYRTFKSGARLGLVMSLESWPSEGVKVVLVSSKLVLTRMLLLKVWTWPLPASWLILPCHLSSCSTSDDIHERLRQCSWVSC